MRTVAGHSHATGRIADHHRVARMSTPESDIHTCTSPDDQHWLMRSDIHVFFDAMYFSGILLMHGTERNTAIFKAMLRIPTYKTSMQHCHIIDCGLNTSQ
ncbi:MAG TPA: hypothetical protein ACQGQH_02340 [Xylella sp.]